MNASERVVRLTFDIFRFHYFNGVRLISFILYVYLKLLICYFQSHSAECFKGDDKVTKSDQMQLVSFDQTPYVLITFLFKVNPLHTAGVLVNVLKT